MKKRNVLAFVLCMWSLCLWAQDAAVGEQKKTAGKSVTVSGTVIEEDTNEPAFSASVVLLKPVDSTLVAGVSSGLDGKFSIKSVKPGKYIFRITSVGFKQHH